MTTELMIREEPQSMALQWEPQDLQALKETVAKDCTDSQFKVFVAAASRLALDPFARQIVPIVQGGRMTPQVTIDGFRLIAQRTGQYAGQIGPFWCGPDGEWREVWLHDDPPVAAKVGVLRRDFTEPMWGVARTASYKSGTPTWSKMPDVMIAKVAESLALRKAFPQELSGVYTAEEMTQAQDETAPAYVEPAAPKANPRDPWAEVRELATQLGLSDTERKALFTRHKKQYEPIVAELRARTKAQAAQEGEYTFEPATEAELAELGTVVP